VNLVGGLRVLAQRHPLLKSVLKLLAAPFRNNTSSAYAQMSVDQRDGLAQSLKFAWQSSDIPAQQRKGVDQQLAAYRAGVPEKGFDVLVEMLRTLNPGQALPTILEVGCSSGYYAEALAIKKVNCIYAGCDYSPAFIEMARRFYPTLDFRVEDATALRYADASFDVVVSGCCLLHIPDYEAAIREASRAARKHVVFHRTPVLHLRPTTYFSKLAYGTKTVEIHFNEQELVALFAKHGLRVISIATLDASWRGGDAFALKSYLCEKALPDGEGAGAQAPVSADATRC
jgi:ubiquinone/menaquinone biosynthesis C-methylase UbiE